MANDIGDVRLLSPSQVFAEPVNSRQFDAATALAWGLVEQVVPVEQLDDAVERLLASILASGPHAIRLQKALVTAWEDLPLREAIQRGIASFASEWESDEPRSMMHRFLAERRLRKRPSPE